jgi:PAS domain-containing protein
MMRSERAASRDARGAAVDFRTLEQLFEHSPRAVQIVDRAGHTRYANHAFLRLLGPALDPHTPEFDLREAGPQELLDARRAWPGNSRHHTAARRC